MKRCTFIKSTVTGARFGYKLSHASGKGDEHKAELIPA